MKIASHAQMDNCPITCADIQAVKHIVGLNLYALKGKAVTTASTVVSGKIECLPCSIMDQYQKAIKGVDIML
jgi:hypothetical protein